LRLSTQPLVSILSKESRTLKVGPFVFVEKKISVLNRAQVQEMADAIPGARFEMLDCAHVLIGNCY